ncbi:hypothetical protein H2204_003373 [Knufia peltigerae]|uniref:Nucleolar protein Dnt1-like N-terminal domain-containing protein n=1 Tax=Knufia peltigerae TaxID=1002370 RepID=A0AA38YAZ2_9EURO|nr:hypothetical protein H2204_003373 [Knufia peltigerae]
MVKLRVAVRVISEDQYLNHADRPAHLPIAGEKRLLVVVREPERWQIGTLALEVQRAYKSCYQHDLPTIKYLRENEDDYDLDPQLYVSDLLVDEGKAARDGADQRATIKVILEQGRAVREGSVAIGSQLDHPQYQRQFQKPSRPPVPTFPGVTSSLGKHSLPADHSIAKANGAKRPRQVEVRGSLREESLVSSIERDESPQLVQATQNQEMLADPKHESPELFRHMQNIPAATLDELEELPEQPCDFAPHSERRGDSSVGGVGGVLQEIMTEISPGATTRQTQIQSQAPITPPTDVPSRRSSSSRIQPATVTPDQRSTSASKFKRRNIYDFPASEIDDSQMSPRSRQAQLGQTRTSDRLSHIERLGTPNDNYDDLERRLSTQEALDVLDIESVLGDTGMPARNALGIGHDEGDPLRPEGAEYAIYEDEAISADPAVPDPSATDYPDADKENRASGLVHAHPEREVSTPQDRANEHPESAIKVNSTSKIDTADMANEMGNEAGQSHQKKTKQTARRAKSKNSRVSSHDAVGDIKTGKAVRPATKVATKLPTKTKKPKARKRERSGTPSLDSPSEQLVQSLKESEQSSEPTTLATVKPKAAARQTTSSATKKTNPPVGKHPQAKVESRTMGDHLNGDNHAAEPTAVVGNVEVNATQLQEPAKPLLHWGSGSTTSKEQAANVSDHSKSLSGTNGTFEPKKKSPSVPYGLTEEEIRIMKSREGMTEEERASRKSAASQKERPHQVQKETPGKSSNTSAKSATPHRETSVLNFSGAKQSETSIAPKTPSVKNSSVKSSVTGKNPTASEQRSVGSAPSTASKPVQSTRKGSVVSKTPAARAKANVRTQVTPKPNPPLTSVRASAPTINSARSLTDLRAALRKADQAVHSTATSTSLSRASSRPGLGQSALPSSDSDESGSESDGESDSEGDGDDGKTASQKPKASTSQGGMQRSTQAGGSSSQKGIGRPDPSIRDKSADSDDDGASSDDDDDDDDHLL